MAAVLEVVLKCRDDASVTLKKVNQQLDSQKKNWEKNYGELAKVAQKAAIGITAIGAASLKFIGSARDMNAQLGMTGITIGATSKQMRGLAISTADADFQLNEVIPTFDLLARAGIRNLEVLKVVSKAFDELGHAAGESAAQVASEIIPTFDTFGLDINDASQYMDKFTYLIKNTTLDLSDFQLTMRMIAPGINATNTSIDEMIPLLVALEDKGIRGRRANALLTDALEKLDEKGTPLIETLNLDAEAVAQLSEEMNNSAGLTEKYAKEHEKHLSIYEKMRAKFQEITFQLGSFLTPLEPALVALTALGPVMLLLSNRTAVMTGMWIAHKAAMIASTTATHALTAAQWALNVAMDANPIGVVIVALVALAAAIGVIIWKWDELTRFFTGKTKEMVYVQEKALSDMTNAELRHIRDTESAERASFATRMLNLRDFYADRIAATDDAYDEEIEAINKLYVEAAKEVSSLQAIQQTVYDDAIASARKYWGVLEDEAGKGYRNMMQLAKDAAQEELDILDAKLSDLRAAYLRGINERTAAIVQGYQNQIDAIDDLIAAEDKLYREQQRADQLTDLRENLYKQTTSEGYFEALDAIEDYEKEIAHERVVDSREAEKEKLRDKMEAAQTAGEKERADFELTGIAYNTLQGDMYNSEKVRLENLKVDKETALAEELGRLEAERIKAEETAKATLAVELAAIETKRLAAIQASNDQRATAIADIQAVSAAAQKALDDLARQAKWESYGTAHSGQEVADKYGLAAINENISDQDVINYIRQLRASSLPITEMELALLAMAYFGGTNPGNPETQAGLTAAIHGYQHGGVVPGPLGSPQLAIVHGGEEYAGVGRHIGRVVNVHFHSEVFWGDEMQARAFASKIRRYIREDERLGGT